MSEEKFKICDCCGAKSASFDTSGPPGWLRVRLYEPAMVSVHRVPPSSSQDACTVECARELATRLAARLEAWKPPTKPAPKPPWKEPTSDPTALDQPFRED